MKRYLAFFGAFNPPTHAHLDLAAFARERTGAEAVWFVPSQSRYIREDQGKDFAYGDEERLAMLRAAAVTRPWMRVSDIEIRQETQPRTYDTLCRLREEGWDAALLLGSDKLPELEHRWLHVEKIAKEFGFAVLTRGSDRTNAMIREDAYLSALAPYMTVLKTPERTRHLSSTAVRERVALIREAQRELKEMVPPEILALL